MMNILGQGITKDLSPIQPDGHSLRVFPSKTKEVPVKQYDSQIELIENSLQLNANARYLFAHAGLKNQSNRRYMVVRVSYIDKIAILEPEGEPLAESDLYATRLYYGWAMYVVITGDEEHFTTEIAAGLSLAGGNLATEAKNHHLQTHVHTIGLQPKNTRSVVVAITPDEISEQFQTPENPVPIYVEYRARHELEVQTLQWKKPQIKPGQYKIELVVELMATKDDGRPWDGFGNPPDPVVTLYDGKVAIAACKDQDSYINTCLSGKVVTVSEHTQFQLGVIDKDLAEDDPVGHTGFVTPVGTVELHQPVHFLTYGQVKNAHIIFYPLH